MNRLMQAAGRMSGVLAVHSPDYDSLFPSAVLEKSFRKFVENAAYKPDPRGSFAAREAVSRWYRDSANLTIDPDDILLTASTSEAYAWLFRAFGHEVAVPIPSYPLIEHILHYCGSMMRRYSLTAAGQIDQIAPADMIVLISPANPTGAVLSAESIANAEAAARERKGPIPGSVIFDEVFSSFRYAPSAFARPAAGLSFTLSGASKLLTLPWLKLSWILCAGPERRAAMEKLEFTADTFLSVNGFADSALPELIAAIGEFHPQLVQSLQLLRDFSFDELSGAGLTPHLPDAGFSMVVEVPPAVRPALSEEEFAIALLEEERVLVHPGYFYDFEPGPKRFVISFKNKKGLLAEAFLRIRRFVSR